MLKTTVPEAPSLRERKKLQTAQRLWRTAIGLFVERGFDQVSVAEIAAAADVSKMTVFNYFPSKEDLVMRPLEEQADGPAGAVRRRAGGQSALDAIRAHFLAGLEEHDPATGLSDDAAVVQVVRLIFATPALGVRALALSARADELLAEELANQQPGGERLIAQVAAAQLLGVRRALVQANQQRMLAGESAAAALPGARANAVRAFAFAERGLGGYGARPAT
ncbi:TetR/AcrR family transcriptional regulator [Kitasatospora sp. NPDC057223]|uniref:TetR/AcrR family transcriptional regulator n=1 Tax=Kitasatospora sp. NPDC057223 TaxID=3346055 RepID=UPI003638A9F4